MAASSSKGCKSRRGGSFLRLALWRPSSAAAVAAAAIAPRGCTSDRGELVGFGEFCYSFWIDDPAGDPALHDEIADLSMLNVMSRHHDLPPVGTIIGEVVGLSNFGRRGWPDA